MPTHTTDSDADDNSSFSSLSSAQAEIHRLQRRCASLAEQAKGDEGRKRKRDTNPPYGRGIPRLADPFAGLEEIIRDADLHHMFLNGGGDQADKVLLASLTPQQAMTVKRTRARNHNALTLLCDFIPNFKATVVNVDPDADEDKAYKLEKQGSNARSHDTMELKSAVIGMLAYNITLNPPVDPDDRSFRGLKHDDLAWLLCPINVDWKNNKEKVRSGEDPSLSLSTSFFCRFLYYKFKGDPENVEKGFLRSSLIVRAYKHIFTSPRSSKGVVLSDAEEENIDPSIRKARKVNGSARKNANTNSVAGTLNMNRVTGRSIAYVCIQVHFALSSAPSWTLEHEGFHYKAFYYFLVDYFEDPHPDSQAHISELLSWWTTLVFPDSLINVTSQNTLFDSQKMLQEQRARRTVQ